ncbi:hypothetical protein AB1Y20_011901 [Prymnesium parvum]|uniref:peptidylprolyl isomerase n=1 Tax=Prymnesium parvum TaxID=97485 RepID=A0AB34IL52_PRYPA
MSCARLPLLVLAALVAHTSALVTPLKLQAQARRSLLQSVTAAVAAALIPSAQTRALDSSFAEVERNEFHRIPGGGQYADLRLGTGAQVSEVSTVSLQWVLRRSNGYFVDGSVKMLSAQKGAVKVADNFDERDNFVFSVGDGRAIAGLDAGVRGMRQGGVRRLVLPVKQAYTLPIDKSGGPLPEGYGPRRQIERELQRNDLYNYFYLEVEASRVR